MSLHAMAETVRSERRRLEAAAPAGRRKNRVARVRQWKEQKRRAWDKARPIFEAAFGRQFTPERFTFEPGTRNGNQYTKVTINYEGKLLAFVNAYNEGSRPWLYVRPVDAPEDDLKTIQVAPDAIYAELAKLIEKWGLG